MKKYCLIFLCLVFFVLFPFILSDNSNGVVYCDDEMSYSEIEEVIQENVNSQLGDLDFSDFEELLNQLGDDEKQFFGSASIIDKINQIISGEFANNQQSIWSAILNLFFDDVLSFLPLISVVIAISVTFSLVSSTKPTGKTKSLGDIIHFVCYGTIIIILVTCTVSMINLTSNTIQSIKAQMDISFPILLTVMTAIGGMVSVGVYQPAVAVLSGTITNIFTAVLMPIFIFRLVFSIISNLSNNVKLEKFASFFSSAFKWIIGSVFTIFSAFLAIQGIIAGSVDGISFRTAKYAIKNTIPLLGSYISDGLNLIVASSVLIKNSVGACGLLLLFATIIVPVVKLVVFMFSLKLASAILEPITDSRITNFISMLAKSISLLIVIIIGCAFMYLLVCGMIMLSANFF